MNNKLLERELQTSISNLKSSELRKMLSFYEHFTSTLVEKSFSKKNSKCHECQIVVEQYTGKGYGRTEEQAFSNAMKYFFSSLISSTEKVQIVRKALKFKEEESKFQTKSSKKKVINEINDTMALDDVSIICTKQEVEEGQNCGCMYYELNQQNERKVKHLEARISLLTEENAMLKKLLFQDFDKENQSKHSNTSL